MKYDYQNIKRITAQLTFLLLLTVKYSFTQGSLIVFEAKGKKGLKDSNGKIVVPAKYDLCNEVGYAKYWLVATGGEFDKAYSYKGLYNGGTWTVFDAEGKVFIEPHSRIEEFLKPGYYDKHKVPKCFFGYFVVTNSENKQGVVNPAGKQLLPIVCDEIGFGDTKEHYLKLGIIPYKLNGLLGIIDTSGKEILKPEYSKLNFPVGRPYPIQLENEGSKIGILSENKNIIPSIYDSIWYVDLSTGRLLNQLQLGKFDILKVSKDGETFYVNDANVRLNETYFKNVSSKMGDYAVSVVEGKRGVVRISDGTLVIPFQYTDLKQFEVTKGCNVFAAKEEGKWICLDTNGKKITEHAHDSLFTYNNLFRSTKFIITENEPKTTTSASWGLFDKGKDVLYYVNQDCKLVSKQFIREEPVAPKPAAKTEPTELQKEVGRIADKYATQKQEYRECMYCSGTGKSKEKQVTLKNCSVCGGGKRISFGNRTGVCTVCDKNGKEVDKVTYPTCQFCRGSGKVKND